MLNLRKYNKLENQPIENKMENSLRSSQCDYENNNFHKAMRDTFQLNRRSIISTSKSKDNKENQILDRCKIKSLPRNSILNFNHREYFVIVFQAIEIQRLSQEVESQRIKIKSFERQIVNSENCQIQVKQLTDQCIKLQFEIGEYREQLQKMNIICQKLYHQSTSYKQKYQEQQKQLRQRLQEQSNKNKRLTHELEVLNNNQRKSLQFAIQKQTFQRELELQINALKQKINGFEETERQNVCLRRTIQDCQRQISKMKQQLAKTQQSFILADESRLMIQNLNLQLKSLREQNQMLSKTLKQKSFELKSNNQKSAIAKKSEPQSGKKKGVKFAFSDQSLQNEKINKLSQQICRLSQLLVSKNKQIDTLYEQKMILKQQQSQKSKQKSNIDCQKCIQAEQYLAKANDVRQNLETQLQKCKNDLTILDCNYKELQQKQQSHIQQLKQIQTIRKVCEKQQEEISMIVRKLDTIQKPAKYSTTGRTSISEKSRLGLENYRKNSHTLKSNVFSQSLYEGQDKLKYSPQSSSILSKIYELETTQQQKQHRVHELELKCNLKQGEQICKDITNPTTQALRQENENEDINNNKNKSHANNKYFPY